MANIKKVYSILFFASMLFLAACNTNTTDDSSYTYKQWESELYNLSTQGASKKIIIDNAHVFIGKTNKLSPGMMQFLNKVIQSLKASPHTKIKITAFTDNRGNPKKSQLVTLKRAMMVADYFRNHGISSARISLAAGGGLHPIASNATEAGRAQNRRIEISFFD